MTAIVTIALPFLGLILIGTVAGRLKAIPQPGLAGLHFFVNYLALPALFFHVVASTPWADFPGFSFVLTTTFATYCAFAIAFSFGALTSRGNVPEATVEGLVGSSANIGIMAPGLVLAALGAQAGAPMALVFVLDFALLSALAPLMLMLGATERANWRAMATDIVRGIFLHPLVIATILGLLAARVRLPLPSPAGSLLSGLAAAASPAALFAFGVDLAARTFGRVQPGMAVPVAIKLIVHPVIVYLLLTWIGGFETLWVSAAVLMAALPPAAGVLVAARNANSYVERAATAFLIGNGAAIVTVAVILALIVDGVLPVDPFR